MKRNKFKRLLEAKPKNKVVRVLKYFVLGTIGLCIYTVEYLIFSLDRFICSMFPKTLTSYKVWRTVTEWKVNATIRVVIVGFVIWLLM